MTKRGNRLITYGDPENELNKFGLKTMGGVEYRFLCGQQASAISAIVDLISLIVEFRLCTHGTSLPST